MKTNSIPCDFLASAEIQQYRTRPARFVEFACMRTSVGFCSFLPIALIRTARKRPTTKGNKQFRRRDPRIPSAVKSTSRETHTRLRKSDRNKPCNMSSAVPEISRELFARVCSNKRPVGALIPQKTEKIERKAAKRQQHAARLGIRGLVGSRAESLRADRYRR